MGFSLGQEAQANFKKIFAEHIWNFQILGTFHYPREFYHSLKNEHFIKTTRFRIIKRNMGWNINTVHI